jgi:putative phosphoribosyl transferase
MMLALKSAIARGAKNIYIATPILDKGVYQNLLTVCDGVFCPHKIDDYVSIEYYYKEFEKLTLDQILQMINTKKTIKN